MMKIWDACFALELHGASTAVHNINPTDTCELCQEGAGDVVTCPCCLVTGHALCFDNVHAAYQTARQSSQHVISTAKRARPNQSWPLPVSLPCGYAWHQPLSSAMRQAMGWGAGMVFGVT